MKIPRADTQFQLRLSQELLDVLHDQALAEERTVTQVIKNALREYMAARGADISHLTQSPLARRVAEQRGKDD